MLKGIWELLRKYAPHPHYGRCVGRKRDCSISVPKDPYDRAAEIHDKELYSIKSLYNEGHINKNTRRYMENQTHKRFAKNLRNIDPKEIPSRYGRIHWWFAKTFFRP